MTVLQQQHSRSIADFCFVVLTQVWLKAFWIKSMRKVDALCHEGCVSPLRRNYFATKLHFASNLLLHHFTHSNILANSSPREFFFSLLPVGW